MAKKTSFYECQKCGFKSAKWIGRCPNCGSWDSFLEIGNKKETISSPYSPKAIQITKIKEEQKERISTGNSEFDLVLGNGLVKSSLVLIGGSPGVGKSTLLLKSCYNIAKRGEKVLYVSAEESLTQIKIRAKRLNALHENLYLLCETNLQNIISEIAAQNYTIVVIDSIQTVFSSDILSSAGSVSQVRSATYDFMKIAKEKGCAIFIVGHITKEGSIAGPRILEHMVDVVLYFEGDSSKEIRILRAFKNRYGSVSEIGIFEMTSKGLIGAKDASKKFFSTTRNEPGSAIAVIIEGSRPIIVEVQALVSPCAQPSPKRSATGFDSNRLTMLLALLERRLKIPLNQYDVFLNITGGIKISETAADLSVIAAILSSYKNRIIDTNTIFVGEAGLTGSIKEVYMIENRLKEASSCGFTKAIIPFSSSLEKYPLKVFPIKDVSKIVKWM